MKTCKVTISDQALLNLMGLNEDCGIIGINYGEFDVCIPITINGETNDVPNSILLGTNTEDPDVVVTDDGKSLPYGTFQIIKQKVNDTLDLYSMFVVKQ